MNAADALAAASARPHDACLVLLAEEVARAEAAEARIAAALAERCEGPMCECCDMVLGALTGGTE